VRQAGVSSNAVDRFWRATEISEQIRAKERERMEAALKRIDQPLEVEQFLKDQERKRIDLLPEIEQFLKDQESLETARKRIDVPPEIL
jgi:hypothetical protein